MDNTYEALFILDSNKYSRNTSQAQGQLASSVEKLGGEMLVSRLWEDGRKLAYPINGQRKGTYWLTYFKLEGTRLSELNRACQLNDSVMRHMFVKLDPRVADALLHVARGGEAGDEEPEDETPRDKPAESAPAEAAPSA